MMAWHWLPLDRMITHKINNAQSQELIEAGRTYEFNGELVLTMRGLHASFRALDALEYAPGPVISRVDCLGEIIQVGDKLVSSKRTVLWLYDASDILFRFAARWPSPVHFDDNAPLHRLANEVSKRHAHNLALNLARQETQSMYDREYASLIYNNAADYYRLRISEKEQEIANRLQHDLDNIYRRELLRIREEQNAILEGMLNEDTHLR